VNPNFFYSSLRGAQEGMLTTRADTGPGRRDSRARSRPYAEIGPNDHPGSVYPAILV